MKDRRATRQKAIKKRTESQKKRKSYLFTFLITILLWGFLGFLVYFVDPQKSGAVPIFFAILFAALFLTFSTLFANTRRGLIVSFGIILFLMLRYLGVGNILNLILIVGVAVSVELFFGRG